jgi:aryl-alcohol dehydrogenase-like predicted oxidoreductase
VHFRQLGHNGEHISVLTFGAWPIAGGMGSVDEKVAISTVQRALDLGMTAIDTAEGYRSSEAIVGRAIAGRPRDRIFLATKVTVEPFTRERVRAALDRSLAALGTDYVDLYQLHRFPTSVPLEEAMAGLAEVKESGKARFVGVSNFTADQLEVARVLYPIQSIQPAFSIFAPSAARDLIPYCHEHNVGVIVHSPLAKGLLTGKYQPGHVFPADDERRSMPRFQGETFARYLAAAGELADIAREKGVSLVQLAIAWTLAHPGVTSCIVGAKTPEQVAEHIGAAELHLSPEDLTRIDAIAAHALESRS